MAADSRCSAEGQMAVSVKKIKELSDGTLMGVAGHASIMFKLLNGDEITDDDLEENTFGEALYLSSSGIAIFDTQLNLKLPIKERFWAIGSGAALAMAAMTCGKTPKEAIEIAAMYDPATALPIDVLTLRRKRNAAKQDK